MGLGVRMETVFLILLFHASLQLQCNNKKITAHVGGEFVLSCKYDTRHYLLSKKYWCRGESRNTCEVLVDSEGRTNTASTHRSEVKDKRRGGLYVKVTHLQFEDSGVYWVGIDKIYADVMTSVRVVITEVPVSKPRLWPLSSLQNRPTCWGQPVTVRCGCTKGTAVRYTWYHGQTLLHSSTDLRLQCGTTVREGSRDFYCIASNNVSSQTSDILSVQVLISSGDGCIFAVNMQGQPVYDCADRLTTTTAPPLTTTQPQMTTTIPSPSPYTCYAPIQIQTEARNNRFCFNQTDQEQPVSGVWFLPLWYTLLRWICFASLLIFLCIFLRCTKPRRKHARRRRRVCLRHLDR